MRNVCQIQMSVKNFQLEENEIVKMGKKHLLHKWQYLIKTGNVDGQARLPCFRNVFILKQNIVVILFLCLCFSLFLWMKKKFANTELYHVESNKHIWGTIWTAQLRLFIQLVFSECLLFVRHCFRRWEGNKTPALMELNF